MEYPKIVLHVDDDVSILRLVAKCLQKHGVEVISVSNPLHVIGKLATSGARVVISDIDMPEKDGLTLLREIKQCDAGIQVIMCTSMVSMSTVLMSTSLGAEGCIFKPLVDLNRVTEAVDRAFDKMDRWWIALREWMELQESMKMTNSESTARFVPEATRNSGSRVQV
jgi:two-component system chemotaxis response regulator CheY